MFTIFLGDPGGGKIFLRSSASCKKMESVLCEKEMGGVLRS